MDRASASDLHFAGTPCQVERGAAGVEADLCESVEPAVVQILIEVANRLRAVH